MKKIININLIVKNGMVVDFEIIENGSRTEFILEGVDDKIGAVETGNIIKRELIDMVE